MNTLVEIRDLIVLRGGRVVLQIDALDIQRSEVLAMIGPNGSGKSTLLLTLARLIRMEHGQILFNGQQTQAESDMIYRRRLALVMQDPLLFDTSVYENVAIGLRFRRVANHEIQTRTEAWLENLGILHLKHRRANQLSGGEAQRVSLARALVLKPELLLLDEPFAALDPPTRSRLLYDLQILLPRSGATTVFVTHNILDTEKLANRLAIFFDSRVQQVGSPCQVRLSPSSKEVADFFAHMSI